MQIRLEETQTPRICTVTIDFTGYHPSQHYHEHRLYGYNYDVKDETLDCILSDLKLRRISYWKIDRSSLNYSFRVRRYLTYSTTVISDRWNKQNDVGRLPR
jgi:hypothetical protein